ncbi:MAG: DUF2812 domain-containing protein [Tuberibacillus sp.]
MKMTKTVVKLFWAWQDEKEEKWLTEMAEEGWHLVKCGPAFYKFTKGEREKAIYKTDFKPQKAIDRNEYLTIFKDAGWEHVAECMGWHYFKTRSESNQYLDIFSDKQSKIQKYKSLLSFMSFILAAIVIIAVTIVFRNPNSYMTVMKWIYAILILGLVLGDIKILQKIKKIKEE